MSWGRYLRLAVIIIGAGLLTIVEGLAQQAQPFGEITSTSESRQREPINQPTDIPRIVSENSVPPNADGAKSVDKTTPKTAETQSEPDIARRKTESMPQALFLPSAAHLSPLDAAYLDAFSILRQDNRCSRFYGGARVIEVLNELKKQLKATYMDPNVAVRMSGSTMSITSLRYGMSYRLFDKAELNLRGSFYHGNTFRHEGTVPPIGYFSPNTREARVTILLHELGHLVEKSTQTWLLPNDGNDQFLSHKNTQQIISVCGEQIRQLSGVSFAAELEAALPSSSGSVVEVNIPSLIAHYFGTRFKKFRLFPFDSIREIGIGCAASFEKASKKSKSLKMLLDENPKTDRAWIVMAQFTFIATLPAAEESDSTARNTFCAD